MKGPGTSAMMDCRVDCERCELSLHGDATSLPFLYNFPLPCGRQLRAGCPYAAMLRACSFCRQSLSQTTAKNTVVARIRPRSHIADCPFEKKANDSHTHTLTHRTTTTNERTRTSMYSYVFLSILLPGCALRARFSCVATGSTLASLAIPSTIAVLPRLATRPALRFPRPAPQQSRPEACRHVAEELWRLLEDRRAAPPVLAFLVRC